MSALSDRHGLPSRRRLLRGVGGAALLGAAGRDVALADGTDPKEPVARNGRIKQSLVNWCYAPYWDVPAFIGVAKRLGCQSIELISPKHFPTLKEAGLTCAIASVDMSPHKGFERGFNNPKYRAHVLKATRDAIDSASAFGVPSVIAFTGMAEDIPRTSARTTAWPVSRRLPVTPSRKASRSASKCSIPAQPGTRWPVIPVIRGTMSITASRS